MGMRAPEPRDAAALRAAVDAASELEVRTGISWRYLPGGRVAHALRHGADGAACGRYAWPSSWLGAGTQAEYERVVTLPACQHCAQRPGSRAELRTVVT